MAPGPKVLTWLLIFGFLLWAVPAGAQMLQTIVAGPSVGGGGACPAGQVCFSGNATKHDEPATGVTSATVTPTGVNTSNGTLISLAACNDGGCTTMVQGTYDTVTVTGGTGSTTCAKISGAETPDNQTLYHLVYFYCPPGVSGSPTYTAAMTASPGQFWYVTMGFTEWQNVNGVEGGNNANGISASPQVTTSGTLSQASGEAIVSVGNGDTAMTRLQTPAGSLSEYQITAGSPTTVTNTWTMTSGHWSTIIAAIKHSVVAACATNLVFDHSDGCNMIAIQIAGY
jgi:hypothetical protein